MLIDVIALALLLLAAWKGLRKGLVLAVFSFLGLVIGLAAAVKLSAALAVYLGENVSVSQRWLPFLAFLLVFFAVALLVRLGARLLEGMLQAAMLGWANRLGGFLFYTLFYLFAYSLMLFYAAQLSLLSSGSLQASVTYPVLAPLGPKLVEWVGVVLPFLRDGFTELLNFFDTAADQQKQSVVTIEGLFRA